MQGCFHAVAKQRKLNRQHASRLTAPAPRTQTYMCTQSHTHTQCARCKPSAALTHPSAQENATAQVPVLIFAAPASSILSCPSTTNAASIVSMGQHICLALLTMHVPHLEARHLDGSLHEGEVRSKSFQGLTALQANSSALSKSALLNEAPTSE